jgi:plasmid maintenance system antidote protein VapI
MSLTARNHHVRIRQALTRWVGKQGVTFTELATRVGVDHSHISNIMAGRRACSIALALALHRETGIPVEIFLTGSDLQVVRAFLASAEQKVS